MEEFYPTLTPDCETMRLRKELEAAQATEKKAREAYEKVSSRIPKNNRD
ncbi:hypothetical protein [Agrobacterium tumefaciens]